MIDGVLTCARYAFAPNYYKYCGPDANRSIAGYLAEGVSDPGLAHYLSEFAVLYPYLTLIAHENGFADPFDPRVVEAYWIGNDLLKQVGMRSFAQHLLHEQHLQKRLAPKKLQWVIEKVPKGAKIHHSFHVLSIFTRTGHAAVEHTLDTMDQCRIGWGEILYNSKLKTQNSRHSFRDFPQTAYSAVSEIGNFGGQAKLHLKTQKLIYEDGKLWLREGIVREVMVPVDGEFAKALKPGDWVTYHWGFVCEQITGVQAQKLAYYTDLNLRLANETV